MLLVDDVSDSGRTLAKVVAIIRDEGAEVRTATLYQGPNLDLLPDILVEWNDAISVGSAILGPGETSIIRATSPRIGTVQAVNNYQRTGEHRVDGMLIAAGPGIAASGSHPDISILDLAPTITAALGVELADVEGRAVRGLVPTVS